MEDVTLRVTRIRSVSGEVITTPNGQIIQVTNLSRDWARAVIDVPVPAAIEVSRVTEVLKRVGEEAWKDDRLRKLMLDPPSVMGVERIEVDTFSVRMVARTLPGMQFDIGRELRARVASAFRQEGINVSADLDTGPRDRGRLMSDPRRRRHRPRDHSRLLAMRPRTSTIVLTVAFLAVFALYILVRPTPASVAAPQPAVSSTPTPVPTPSTSSPAPSASPTRTPEPSHSATPALSATPSGSATSGLGTAPGSSPSPASGSPGPTPTGGLP